MHHSLIGLICCFLFSMAYAESAIQTSLPISSKPAVGIDSLGNAMALWQSNDDKGNYYIQASTFHPGSTWSTPTTLSLTGQTSSCPVFVLDDANNAVVIWCVIDDTTKNNVLYGSMFIAGTGGDWSTPAQISSKENSVFTDYRLAINSNRNVVAIWSAYNSDSTQQNIWVSMANIGESWSTPVKISP